MSTSQAKMFEQEFPLDNKILCHDLKTANNILHDITGFIQKHNVNVNIVKHDTYTAITGRGTVSSECVLMINDYSITQINTYYNESEVVSKDITWKNLRRCLITMFNCS